MSGWIRAAGLSGFGELVRQLGGRPEQLCEASGVDPAGLSNPESMVALPATAALLEHAADALKCPTFGLRLGGAQSPELLGMLALLIRGSVTVGEAVDTAARFMFMHSSSYELAIVGPTGTADPRGVSIRFDVRLDETVQQRQLIDGCVASLHSITSRLLTGRPLPIRCVSLPHTPIGESASYRAHFDADIRFEQPFAEILVDRGVLDVPLAPLEPQLRRRAQEYITAHAGDVDGSVTEQVRRVIKSTLGSGRTTKTDVAALLEMHPRTLQRRLGSENTTFDQIHASVQAAATQRLLRETTIPLAQVAATLGFSEQSSMNRFIRRHFDTTPRRIRLESRPR